MSRPDSTSLLDVGRNCWRIEHADRAALIVDAADYFRHARQAMMQAQRQILLIGWDFDTRISLDREPSDEAPAVLGSFISWLAGRRPDLSIYILRWDWGAPKLLARGTTIFRLLNWARSRQINFKLDGAHPLGGSHHQKIVVIDDQLAFCGGIDMTATRWDTREHRDGEIGRRRPTTGRRYQPWHDATMAVEGNAARALGELSRERWQVAGGAPIVAPEVQQSPWPRDLTPHFTDVDVAIARTRGAHKHIAVIREIEALYVDMIGRARSYVYLENQFFASRIVAEAIAKRLQETDGPEFVVINPKVVEGWIEDEVMSPARAELLSLLRTADHQSRLRIYTPVTTGGEDIYVHSKIGIVDGELLRVGSANMNNRSMGLDSECDVFIDGAVGGHGVADAIRSILADLLAEHLGVEPARVSDELSASISLIDVIEGLRGRGRTLVPLAEQEPNAFQSAVASSEALDPEAAGGYLAPSPRGGLLHRLRDLVRRT